MKWINKPHTAASTLPVIAFFFSTCLQANAYLDDARKYYASGDTAAATIQLKNLLRDEPRNAEGRLLMGQIHLQASNWPAAEKELSRAQESGADSTLVTPLLAEALVGMQSWDQALNLLFLEWSDQMPQQALRWALIGTAQLGKQALEEAENAYYRSIEIKPNDLAKLGLALVAQSRGNFEEALAELNLISGNSREARRARLIRAELLRRVGRTDDAFQAYSELVEEMPDNLAAHLGRAQSGVDSGKLEAARSEVDLLLKKLPKSPDVRLVAGLLALAEKRNNEANEQAQILLQMAPNHPQALMLAGAAAFYAGNLPAATGHLRAVIDRTPGHLLANRLLADALLRQKQPEQVLSLLEPLFAQGVNDGVLKALAGNAHLQRGDFDEGAQLLDEAAKSLPPSDKLTTQRALTRLLSGNSGEALDLLSSQQETSLQSDVLTVAALMRDGQLKQAKALLEQRLKSLSGADATAYALMLGVLQQRQGELEDAEHTFKTAADNDVTNPAPWLALSRVALQQKNYPQTEAHFKAALQRQPDNLAAMLGLARLANQLNDAQTSAAWLNRAKAAHPSEIRPIQEETNQLIAKGQHDRALNAANNFYLQHKQNTEAALLFAKLLRLNNQRARAINLLRPLYDATPDKRPIALLLATLLKENGDFIGSKRITQRLIDADGPINAAGVLHAEILLLNKEYSEAGELLEQLWQQSPQPLVARLRFIQAYSNGQIDRALSLQQSVYPEQRDAQLLQMLIRLNIQSSGLEAAEQFLQDHHTAYPDDNFALLQAATLAQQLGKTAVAIQRFEQLKAQQPDNPVAWNNLAWIYETQADSRSLSYAREANRLAPESPDIQDTLGWILLRQGKIEEARKYLEQAHSKLSDNPEVTLHLAEAMLAGADTTEAQSLLTPLLDAQPVIRERAQELINRINR